LRSVLDVQVPAHGGVGAPALSGDSFPGQPLVGVPVALAFILQMITASLFYRYLLGHTPQPQRKDRLRHA